jgi:cell division protein FtsL
MAYAKEREERSLRTKLSSQKGKRNIIAQSWWVVLFICICSIVYAHASYKKNELIASLDEHLSTLKNEKDALLQEKEDLLLQINSQSDPAWIQLTLMKGLGLVPEGQLKVYFHSGDD